MEHADHVFLLREGVMDAGETWADFGSGTGAFTLALADLLGVGGRIFSIDRDAGALHRQAQWMQARFPETQVVYIHADFTRAFEAAIPPLDGIVMANALHFVTREKQGEVLRKLRGYLKPGGRFILVEYNTDRGNPWVPYPLSYSRYAALAQQCGFQQTRFLAKVPSSFLNEFYSALSV
jgi:ubiquinone/menaquinone biosynthesis C-methylase UbiE